MRKKATTPGQLGKKPKPEQKKKNKNLMRLWRRFDRQDQAKIARAGTDERAPWYPQPVTCCF